MNNIMLKSAALAVSLALAGGAAYANVKGEWPSFSRVDQNRDGYVDTQEVQSIQDADLNISNADSDGDGRINRSEYTAAMHLNNNPEDSLGTGKVNGNADSRSRSSDPGNAGSGNISSNPESSSTSGSPAR